MNRRKSSVYTSRLDLLYAVLVLILLPIRLWIDRGLDHQALPAALAQPLFWFFCGMLSLVVGAWGLRIRCGLRLQLRFLLIATVYFSIILLLNSTGISTPLLVLISVILGALSVRVWHGAVYRVLSCRAFRITSEVATAGDLTGNCVRIPTPDSEKNPFAQRQSAR